LDDAVADAATPVAINGEELHCADPQTLVESPTLGQSLAAGCPAPFAELGLRMGAVELSTMLQAFGLDQPAAIRLPSDEGAEWSEPDDAESLRLEAVGQGELAVTPLQMAHALASFWNAGALPSLRLVDAVRVPEGTWQSFEPLEASRVAISADAAVAILAALNADDGLSGVTAVAITGPEGERVTWFLGGTLSTDQPFVIVVVLEDASPQVARSVALEIAIELGLEYDDPG
jgi:membrane peptidoglycan carboxypeptidase